MDQVPSVPNLLSRRGLLNLMIWVIIDECFEPIRCPCETLIVFVSRVRLRDGGTDALKTALRSTHSCCKTGRQEHRSPHSEGSSRLNQSDEG